VPVPRPLSHKFDVVFWVAMLPAHVSRTDDEKGPVASRGGATGQGADDGGEPVGSIGERPSSVHPIGGYGVPDETERTRLIADIMRLIREPAMPETTRMAGMNLIGWLARRRPDEAPHALGIDEARESERRIRAARKTR
jgi:hypothetical protein